MKKIYAYILSTAAVLALAACNKELQVEDPAQSNEPFYETLSVKVGAETKVSLATDATTATFEDGDKIAVYTEAGSFQDCTVSSGTITVDVTGGARSNYAVYYNGATKPALVSSELKIMLPSEYDYADVSGTKNPVPMVAKNVAGDASDMSFYAVCALARITVPGISATADKLVVTFDKDVTGEFAVANPGTDAPSISAVAATSKNVVTINLTPGTDYSGVVINIPVPVGTITASIEAKNGSTVIESLTSVIDSWSAARANAKKATAAFTPSMSYMVFAPGNLYTEAGTLNIASNYYEHVYALTGNKGGCVEEGYQATNRTHFNFNEAYLLMHGTTPSEITYGLATTNVAGDEPVYSKSDIAGGNGKAWHIPSYEDLYNIFGIQYGAAFQQTRPGAKVRNGESGEYTAGWMWVKVLVSGMDSQGTSSSDGTVALPVDATGPSTDYQAGLLLFPDNVEITGTFNTLGTKNTASSAYNTTTLTKGNLNALITDGCAFLPAAGRFGYGDWGQVGIGGSIINCYRVANMSYAYMMTFSDSSLSMSDYSNKSTDFRHVRLVRYLN